MLWNDISSAPQAAALIEKMGEAPAEEGEPEDVLHVVSSVGSRPLAPPRCFLHADQGGVGGLKTNRKTLQIAAICLPHDWLSWRIAGYGPVAKARDAHQALFTDRSDASGTIYYDAASNEYRRDLIAMVLEPAEGTERREHAAQSCCRPCLDARCRRSQGQARKSPARTLRVVASSHRAAATTPWRPSDLA